MASLKARKLRGFSFAAVALAALGLGTLGLVEARFFAPEARAAADTGVLRATLKNGLRVIIVRNSLAPVVATSVNYLVGSNNVPDGFPGTAHALEHMMFRGSPGMTADQLADIGSVMGGNFNANTRENLTQFLFTVPSEDIDVALRIEATRMQGLTLAQKDWDQERGAISQEVAQDLSSPNYILFAKLREIMFAGTPYEHDALGTRPSFEKTTSADLKTFYGKWYAPNNAILVVVGNLNPQATLAKVRELFTPIPPKALTPHPAINPKPLAASTDPISLPTDNPNAASVIAMRMP